MSHQINLCMCNNLLIFFLLLLVHQVLYKGLVS
uniref:Uncharacterized protein n=1 Tax=Zea mays TaxID=4577 RepID=C4J7I8_MAIZE|nr:unknown [Zea mays]